MTLFLLKGVSWPYFRRHWVISLLTAAGVAMGVGVYIAIELSSMSLRVSMRQTVNRIAGSTQLEVTAGEVGVPEDRLELVRAVSGVASAQPVVEATVRPVELSETALMVLGIDFLGDRSVREWDFSEQDVLDDPLIFLAQPDSICITTEFAARHGLELDQKIVLETGHGLQAFTVRGMVEASGPATAFGGNIAVMDLYAAQYMFARGTQLDRIDVVLEEGNELGEVKARLAGALGTGFDVATPARRSAQMEASIQNFGANMSLSSWQATFIAVFLIFNVFAVAAARRRREIGILRSLGVTRRRIRGLFLAEGAIMGGLGTLLGLGAGLLLAGGVTAFTIQLTEMAYGQTHSAPELVIEPRVLVTGFLLGILSALAAAYFPACRAARLDPVEALAVGRFRSAGTEHSRGRLWAGVSCAALAAFGVFALAPRGLPGTIVTLGLINLAAVFLAPFLIGPIVRLMRPALGRVFGVEGRLAAESLIQAPQRTSATALALMLAVGYVINLGGMVSSYRNSYESWLDQVLNADFYIQASERFVSQSYRIPPEFADQVAAVPGVRWVEPYRAVRLDYQGKRPMMLSLPLELTHQRLESPIVKGDRREYLEKSERGEGIAVSDNFERLYGVGVGDTLTLPSPTGTVSLPVLAVVRDYSSDQGTIWLNRRLYVERWRDETIDILDVMLEPGVDKAAAASAIRQRLAGSTNRLFILTSANLRAVINRILDQFFGILYMQLAIALLVALLGVANTLVISVAERRRELGILKALGTERRQVVRLVVAEALGITAVGGLLGYVLGSYLIRFSGTALTANISGWTLTYAFPFGIAGSLIVLLTLVAVAAALYPARMALKVSPAEALVYE
ncbi:MAG: FtsX-like permease family protein [bacterium]|nr:FtsX-like permease family protein [bacterium]